jgi:hypothetical protein
VPPAALSGVSAIAAGGDRTLALKNGGVIAWGDDSAGQSTVPATARSGVVAIAASNWHTVALNQDSGVIAWGANNFNETNVPTTAQSDVVTITAGQAQTLVLKQDGSLIAWGANTVGQTNVPSAARGGVIAITAGAGHTVALQRPGIAFGSTSLSGIGVAFFTIANQGDLPWPNSVSRSPVPMLISSASRRLHPIRWGRTRPDHSFCYSHPRELGISAQP